MAVAGPLYVAHTPVFVVVVVVAVVDHDHDHDEMD